MRGQVVRTRRQLKPQWRAAARFSIYRNLGASWLARDVCCRANKRERLVRCFSTCHLNVVAHFPITAMRNHRIFSGRKIDNRLRRRALARNLTVFTSKRKLRASWLRLDFESRFAPNEMKGRRSEWPLTGEIDR